MEALGGFAIAGCVHLRPATASWVLNLPPVRIVFPSSRRSCSPTSPPSASARLNIRPAQRADRRSGAVRCARHFRTTGRRSQSPPSRVTRGLHRIRPGFRFALPGREARYCGSFRSPQRPGQVTAFVGPSGGGKSTIFQSGAGALYNTPERRRHPPRRTGIMAQYPRNRSGAGSPSWGRMCFLFHGTIRHNIGLGRPGASEAEIVAAARGGPTARRIHLAICRRIRDDGGRTRWRSSPAAQRQRVANRPRP